MKFDEPESIDITSLEDSYTHHIISRPPYTITSAGDTLTYYPPSITGWQTDSYTTSITAEDWSKVLSWKELMEKLGKKEEAKVEVLHKNLNDHEYIVYCKNTKDLSPENILDTLSAVKGRLMYDVMTIHIKEIQCKMTPMVKKHLVEANKKLKMYGKEIPIVPSFDEYANRLPDEIIIGDGDGITVQIVEPELYGEKYIELKAIKFPISSGDYIVKHDWTYDIEDLPF